MDVDLNVDVDLDEVCKRVHIFSSFTLLHFNSLRRVITTSIFFDFFPKNNDKFIVVGNDYSLKH